MSEPAKLHAAVREAIIATVGELALPITAYDTSCLVQAVTTAIGRHYRPPAETATPAPGKATGKVLGPIPHGTAAGYGREAYRKLPHCDPCRKAMAAAQAERRTRPPEERTGRKATMTLAEIVAERTTPEDDHLVWAGGQVRWQGERLTGAQAAWSVHRSRPYVGYIRRTCKRSDCVAHLADRRDREFEDAVMGTVHAD
ncbi:hypothetical protein [Embleya scabrispora]|uniref:hypothetical protein n=1 Tax=Embleya scabrispora TaxID=159449 RepID=UPI0013750185|nr:hypothetical protein [Embleya scabrispora]